MKDRYKINSYLLIFTLILLHLSPFQCLDLLTYVSTACISVSSYHGFPFHILDLLQLHVILLTELAQVWGFTVPYAVDSQPQFRFSSTLTTGIHRDPPFALLLLLSVHYFYFLFFTVILIISSIITYVNILRVLNVVQNTKPASLNPQNQMVSAGFWRGCALPKAAEWGVLDFCCHNPQVAPAQVLVRRVSPVSPEEWSKWSCHSPPSSAALAFITWTCSWPLQTRLYWAPPQNNILGELFLLSHFEETPREWGPLSEGIPKLVLKVLIKENKEWN